MDKKALSITRSSIKRQLTSFETYVTSVKTNPAAIDAATSIKLKCRLDEAAQMLMKFRTVQDNILILDSSNESIAAEELKRDEYESQYYTCVAEARMLLDKYESSKALPLTELTPTQNSIQLPKMSLPTFSGESTKWLEFREKFVAVVHNNPSLSDIQKFHYLRSCLHQEAATVIVGVSYTAAHYMQAWNLLLSRYNNERLLAHNHIREIFNLSCPGRETSSKLLNLLDNLNKHMHSIQQVVSENTNLFDLFLVYLIASKLDYVTSRDWETFIAQTNRPITLDDLKHFLRERASVLASIEARPPREAEAKRPTQPKPRVHHSAQNQTNILAANTNMPKCFICPGDHYVKNCPLFISLPVPQRVEKIKTLRRCLNCLRHGHMASICTFGTCLTCRARHHTLLHPEASPNLTTAEPIETAPIASAVASATPRATLGVLLSTALVHIRDTNGTPHTARMLLESGSQANFVTSSLARRLRLPVHKANMSLRGITGAPSFISKFCNMQINSTNTNCQITCSAYVLPHITSYVPPLHSAPLTELIPPYLQLADPSFGQPGPIDLLLGVEHFYGVLLNGHISLGPGGPFLRQTSFGWVISGMAAGTPRPPSKISCNLAVEDALERFWAVESVPETRHYSEEEAYCEAYFQETTKRDENGRFIVSIPNRSLDQLGDTKDMALQRFLRSERSLQRKPDLFQQYCQFMKEYRDMGHMRSAAPTIGQTYHLPHHAVLNQTSESTKLRVVFDGSARPPSGRSLNECQMVGPTVQDTLFSILVRFRKHSVAFSADVAKMYRQILIDPRQRSLQRILWRSSPDQSMQTFELNTVTYGTAAASFLSTRCLIQIANELQSSKPIVANCIRHDFYVDDLLSGAESTDEAASLIHEVFSACSSACFPLRKWKSNAPSILAELLSDHDSIHDFSDQCTSKTLGLLWNPRLDHLCYRSHFECPSPASKRKILSVLAQVFDPLGLLAPFTVLGKVLMQCIWKAGTEWDDPLPTHLLPEWNTYLSSLRALSQLRLPRQATCPNVVTIDLHGFADASSSAYGACLYLRCIDQLGNVTTRLLCAKTKVAPLKVLSIPRLELCAAVLLADLAKMTVTSLRCEIRQKYHWTDSTIVLAWLRLCPSTLRTFVANRVAKIQQIAPASLWRHVPSSENPADAASRGLNMTALITETLWWDGPRWLRAEPPYWPPPIDINPHALSEGLGSSEGKLSCHNASLSQPLIQVERFSSLTKVTNVTAFVLRFVRNIRCRDRTARQTGQLSQDELQSATWNLLQREQHLHFPRETLALRKGLRIDARSPLLPLNPQLDGGLLRVGGRLQHSLLTETQRHPIILPKASHFTSLLIEQEHKRLLHAGAQATLSSLRLKYWPIADRSAVRKVLKRCITCFRCNLRPVLGTACEDAHLLVRSGAEREAGRPPFVLVPGSSRKTAKQ